MVLQPMHDREANDGSPARGPSDTADALAWVAAMLRKGLAQVVAVQLAECFESKHHGRLQDHVRRQTADAVLAEQLGPALQSWAVANPLERAALVERLGSTVFAGVDRVLEQAQAAARDRSGVHLAAARFGTEVVILADPDPRQAWLLPATQTRLREALAELGFYPTAAETQELDLAQGDTLQLLGHEFRLSAERHGGWHVDCRAMRPGIPWLPATEALTPSAAPAVAQASEKPGAPPGPRTRKPGRAPAPKECPDESDTDDDDADPGRAEPVPALSPAEPPSGERPQQRRPPTRLERGLARVRELLHRVQSFEVGWRHLPMTLYPVLGFLAGWNSPLAWLCLALIVAGNWRSVPALAAFAWRHRLNTVLTVCAISVVICLAVLWRDFYAQVSHEVAEPNSPPGFYLGQYNISWDDDPVPYGVYVPPHFAHERGPFPLIVFLHGLGINGPKDVFARGLAESIVRRFGTDGPNGRFEFVAYFPYNPTPSWDPRSEPVERILRTLDHVIRRHRVDPARCYLSGVSNGATGVWRLAQAYPERWAAVAPVASFIHPDVAKVRHLPAWIVHGGQDRQAPVERVRDLVRKLEEAQAPVRYVEVPQGGHLIARAAFDNQELYEWLAKQVRK